jgi:hypothetical protein
MNPPYRGRVLAREFHEPPLAGLRSGSGSVLHEPPYRGRVLAREFHEPPPCGAAFWLWRVLLKMMIPEMKTAEWIDLNSVGEEA